MDVPISLSSGIPNSYARKYKGKHKNLMKKAIAVFDIDGTLLKGTSAERIFVRYLLSKGELHLINGFNVLWYFCKTFHRNWVMATKGNRFYLKGKKVDRIEELGEECFRAEIMPRISNSAIRMIREHRGNGYKIVLLSGTPDFLLKHIHDHLETDFAYGSTLEVFEGHYTGCMSGLYPYGRAKADIVRTHFGHDQYDLTASYAYADHFSDIEFLKLFGHPIIVNPSPKLAAKVKKLGIHTAVF